MSTQRRIFVFLGAHDAGIGLFYYLLTRDILGAVLLVSMGAAALFVVGYLLVAAGRARAAGPSDRPDARAAEGSGEEIVSYPGGSAWPILLALALMLVAAGLAYGIWLLTAGVAILLFTLVGFWRER